MNYSEKLQQIPADILRASDYAQLASSFIPEDILAYIDGGAGDEWSLRRNRSAFEEIQLLPKILADFSAASTQCQLLGQTLSHPFILGPVAHQKLVHCEGELATAQAAEAMHTGMITSTLSSVPLADIAAFDPPLKWFQLYWQTRRDDNIALIRRAEQAGYGAIVLTIDVPINALRYREQRAGFVQPAELPAVNLQDFPPNSAVNITEHESLILNGIMPNAPSWNDIAWLCKQTSLPVLIKGILNPEDAKRAKRQGLSGVIVSNHGGRSLDGVPATIDVLASIRHAVGNEFPLLLDSGIRSGSDIFKALALGADAVLIGRLQMHALAVAGALGVAHMLRLLREELEVTMALAGCPTLNDIDPSAIISRD